MWCQPISGPSRAGLSTPSASRNSCGHRRFPWRTGFPVSTWWTLAAPFFLCRYVYRHLLFPLSSCPFLFPQISLSHFAFPPISRSHFVFPPISRSHFVFPPISRSLISSFPHYLALSFRLSPLFHSNHFSHALRHRLKFSLTDITEDVYSEIKPTCPLWGYPR